MLLLLPARFFTVLAQLLRLFNATLVMDTHKERRFALSLTIIFFALALFGVLHHEMWRDELQSWLIARESGSLAELFDNTRYESHPLLWYVLLFFVSRLTFNPVAMQILHAAIAAAFVYVFTRYAPFTRLHRALFVFSYFSIYEYSIISRSYGLGVLLVFIFCALYAARTRGYKALALILLLLANTSVYGLIIAVAMGATLVVERVLRAEMRTDGVPARDLAISITIFALGMAAGFLQLLTPADRLPQPEIRLYYHPALVSMTALTVFRSYLPIPIFTYQFWNSNLFLNLPWSNEIESYLVFVSVLLIVVSLLLLARKPLVCFLYFTGLCGIFFFTYVSYVGTTRHVGHIFLLFIACLWLSSYYEDSVPSMPLLRAVTGFFDRHRAKLITALLSIQVFAGVYGYCVDLVYPFTGLEATARYIQEQRLQDHFIVGHPATIVSPLSALIDRKIYFLETGEQGTFLRWNFEPQEFATPEFIARVMEVVKRSEGDVLLILNYELTVNRKGQATPLLSARLDDSTTISFLASFSERITPDEKYYLYQIKKR